MEIRAVDRAFHLLRCLGEGAGLGLSELARRAGIAPSTAHRFLKTMERHGVVTRDGGGDKYRLGPALISLGTAALAATSLQEAALPVMRDLRDQVNETVHLNVRVGFQRLCIQVVECTHPLRLTTSELGVRKPLYRGSAGRVLLAHEPPEFVAELIAHAGAGQAWPAPPDPADLHRQLARIRADGYGCGHGEGNPGTASVTAPVFNHAGQVVASLTCAGPAHRLPQEALQALVEPVTKAARRLSQALGWQQRASGGGPAPAAGEPGERP